MPQLLCEEFCLVTKERLGAVLGAMKASGTLSVRVLIDTMKATLAFEKELNKRFAGAPGGGARRLNAASAPSLSAAPRTTPAQDQAMLLAEQNAKANPFSPEALKLKWKKFQQEKAQQPTADEPLQPCTRFTGILSEAFEPYLDIYVSFEEKELSATMTRITRQQPDVFEDRNLVFESSQIMFDQFKEVMDTCTSLSRGAAFLQVSELFRANLRVYSDYLMSKLPRVEPGGGAVKLKEGEEKTVCFVINTAEYCTSNVEALAETVKNHIASDMASRVEMANEQDRFQTVVARGMQALVRALETRVVLSAFAKMQKQNWSGQDSVVVESEYVGLVDSIVREGAAVSKWLSKSRFYLIFDTFSNTIITRQRQAILSLKAVNEVGAEQLLLDVAHVKTTLDALPKLGGDRVPARYKRIVQKEIGRLERMIKGEIVWFFFLFFCSLYRSAAHAQGRQRGGGELHGNGAQGQQPGAGPCPRAARHCQAGAVFGKVRAGKGKGDIGRRSSGASNGIQMNSIHFSFLFSNTVAGSARLSRGT
jgi:hypothetical protein